MTHSLSPIQVGRPAGTSGVLAAIGAFTGLSAIGSAVALMFGALDFGDTVTSRLPFQSPVLAGLALAVIVGLPTLTLTLFALRHDARTDVVAIIAGVALLGWIAVQLAVIRELSWLQAVFATVGAVLVLLGRHKESPRS